MTAVQSRNSLGSLSDDASSDDEDFADLDLDLFYFTGTTSQSSEADNEDSETETNKQNNNTNHGTKSSTNDSKPLMTLKQRRRTRGSALTLNILASIKNSHSSPVRNQWKLAMLKAQKQEDPWLSFHIEELTTETAIRHRYNALKKKWSKDVVHVKMQTTSFNRGALRQCFRLKKLSGFSRIEDWTYTTPATNYVAKKYMETVDRQVYFDDVVLQMDAKLWGEEYNRHNPPKKVDIFQMNIIEFTEREGSPLYHLEHYIEGDYVKYNSNSGFVEEAARLTPQAFSHFTFERSGHQLIVVDIQGVGCLYTDPQIHTANGKDYGEGNLGTRGMGLFFHSHVCNEICEGLSLSHFDLSLAEQQMIKKYIAILNRSTTRVKGDEESCVSASPREQVDLTEFLKQRTISSSSSISDGTSEGVHFEIMDEDDEPQSEDGRNRYYSTSPDCDTPTYSSTSESDTMSKEQERQAFSNALSKIAKPSSIAFELNMRNQSCQRSIGTSVLGQVHHEVAKYHELGRFSPDQQHPENNIDWESAIYHEEIAAQLGVMEAIMTLARMYLTLQHDVLVNCTVQPSEENINRGLDYMVQAARAGERTAMIYLATIYDTGIGLGTERTRSYADAMYWYDKALLKINEDDSGEYDSTTDHPKYQLIAKKAELYMKGGFDLEIDAQQAGDLYSEAAEDAMTAMKGKLSNKYYCLAEEAYGMVEE